MDPKNLSNEDFRKIMMTPRSAVPPSMKKVNVDQKNDQKKFKKISKKFDLKKKEKKQKPHDIFEGDDLLQQDADTIEMLKSKYRDRAEERRIGKTTFEDQVEAISSLYETMASQNYPSNEAVQINETKTLYQTVDLRPNQNKIKDENVGGVENDLAPGDQPTQNFNKLELLKSIQKPRDDTRPINHEKRVNSVFAKNLLIYLESLSNGNAVKMRGKSLEEGNLFKTRRIAYEFNIESDETVCLPTIITRSKSEHSKKQEVAITTTHSIIKKLYNILGYLRHEPSTHNKEVGTLADNTSINGPMCMPKQPTSSIVETSIYDDIGEYSVEDTLKTAQLLKSQQDSISNIKATELFTEKVQKETLEKSENLRKEPIDSSSGTDANIKDLNFTDVNAMKMLASEAREAKYKSKIQSNELNYAECYPSTFVHSLADSVVNKNIDQKYHSKSNSKGSQTERKNSIAGSMSVRDSSKMKHKLESEWNQISRIIEKRKHTDTCNDDKNTGPEYRAPKNSKISQSIPKDADRLSATPSIRRRRLI